MFQCTIKEEVAIALVRKYCQISCFAESCLYLVQYSRMISIKILFLEDTQTHFTETYILEIYFKSHHFLVLVWIQLIFVYPVCLVSDAKYGQKRVHCVMYTALQWSRIECRFVPSLLPFSVTFYNVNTVKTHLQEAICLKSCKIGSCILVWPLAI